MSLYYYEHDNNEANAGGYDQKESLNYVIIFQVFPTEIIISHIPLLAEGF